MVDTRSQRGLVINRGQTRLGNGLGMAWARLGGGLVRNIYGYHQVCGRDGNECGLVWDKRDGRNRYQLISLETWSAEAIWVKKADTFWVWQSCSCWLTLTFLLLATFMPDAEHLLGSVALQKKADGFVLSKIQGSSRYASAFKPGRQAPCPAAACGSLPRASPLHARRAPRRLPARADPPPR